MPHVNQVFPSAAMGRRVLFSSVLAIGVLIVMLGINVYFVLIKMPQQPGSTARLLQIIAPVLPLLLISIFFFTERSRIAQFRIEDDVLVLGKKRFPLQGLVEAVRDPEVMHRALRKFGNSGMGSIRGRFWSKRLGNFYAFLTGTENAVVLRWRDKVVAVSPADPQFFIYSARAAAGLK
jgi:hypothetical protein